MARDFLARASAPYRDREQIVRGILEILALEQEPRLPSLLRAWTFMGGAFRGPGNTTPTAEWNVFVDPDAAQRCLAAIESQPRLLRFFAVTGVTLLFEQRLNVFDEIDLAVGGWWELSLSTIE